MLPQTEDSNHVLEDLVAMREFPRIDREMSVGDGIKLLAKRFSLSCPGIHRAMRKRYPAQELKLKNERSDYTSFRIRCFLRSDIVFTDILHTGYDELKFLKLGRKYLINKLLRVIVAGMCDTLDPSGCAGDFPDRTTLSDEKASVILKIQRLCLSTLKVSQRALLTSIVVRLRKISTPVLQSIVNNLSTLRKEIRKASKSDLQNGLKWFSAFLSAYRSKLEEIQYGRIKKARSRASNRRAQRRHTPCKKNSKLKYTQKDDYTVFRHVMTGIRNFVDPTILNWYRRPSDPDWAEGLRSDRKVQIVTGVKYIKKMKTLDFKPFLGSSGEIKASEWGNIRTDLKISEVRSHGKKRTAHSRTQ